VAPALLTREPPKERVPLQTTGYLSPRALRARYNYLGVAQHHAFLRTANIATFAPPFAATIARGSDRRPPPSPQQHPTRRRPSDIVYWRSISSRNYITTSTHDFGAVDSFMRHNNALRRRTTRSTTLHDNRIEVPPAGVTDAIEFILH
jgi:hypothetical protein